MLSFKRSALLLVAAAGMVAGQPALTTIQDILYSANGSRYNGTLFITWSAFQSGDSASIATANLTVPIVNGVLNVQLVPTTTASAGAQYNVTFNSAGRDQFTQVWSVPPSTTALTVRDVMVSQGTVVGPPPVTTSVPISDVTGLQGQLAIRPQQGPAFAIGRVAVIDSSGEIDGAAGNLGDCVHVDGSSGPCGSATSVGASGLFSDDETPAGAVNGSNATFTLANAPSPSGSLDLYLNGLLMSQRVDYALSGHTVTFFAASTPQAGDILVANYRYVNSASSQATAMPQVICSSVGTSTQATTLTQLGTCTIAAGVLATGDRVEVQFQFGHGGTSTGFTGTVSWGGTSILSRTAAAGESAFVGRLTFGIGASGQSWGAQSWGNSLSLAGAAGLATVNTSGSVTISFQADMAGSTTDTIALSNFTVIRYPAQSNP